MGLFIGCGCDTHTELDLATGVASHTHQHFTKMDTLQAPEVRDESFDKQYKRTSSTYVNKSKRFVVPRTTSHKSYAVQYSHLYFVRLAAMRPVLERAASQKWGVW